MGFVKGFEKTAASMPKWLHESHKAISSKAMPQHSKNGLRGLLKRRLGK